MSEGSAGEVKEELKTAFEAIGMRGFPDELFSQLASYLELLVRWNSRLNLTAVRDVSEIIRTHFVECAFAASHVPSETKTLLDYGSGAGFPGIVIAACRPDIRVTLAEAHTKKASFLREAVRTTGVGAEVFNGRVDLLDPTQTFDGVTLRAVEHMQAAVPVAIRRAKRHLMVLTTAQFVPVFSQIGSSLEWLDPIPVPNTVQRVLLTGRQPFTP